MRSVVVLILCTYFWIYCDPPPDAQILHLWGGGEYIGGPGPTRGTGNSNTGKKGREGRTDQVAEEIDAYGREYYRNLEI